MQIINQSEKWSLQKHMEQDRCLESAPYCNRSHRKFRAVHFLLVGRDSRYCLSRKLLDGAQSVWLAQTLRANGIFHLARGVDSSRHQVLHHPDLARLTNVRIPYRDPQSEQIRWRRDYRKVDRHLGDRHVNQLVSLGFGRIFQLGVLCEGTSGVLVLHLLCVGNIHHPDHDVQHADRHHGWHLWQDYGEPRDQRYQVQTATHVWTGRLAWCRGQGSEQRVLFLHHSTLKRRR